LRLNAQGTVKFDEVAANFDERTCSPCVPSIAVGDPIDTSTGAFTLQRTDIEIEALGPDLDFRRRYLARGAFTGTLGYRWIHNWDWRIERVEGDGSVLVRYGDGSLHAFPYDSGFGQESDATDRLERFGSPGTYTYTLTTRDQLHYDFGLSGRLDKVRDRNSNPATLTYGAGGQLEAVAVGARSISFTYASNLLTAVEDPLGRRIEFAYDTASMPRLTVVTDTLGHAWRYGYVQDRLESEIDGRGERTFFNVYDGASRIRRQDDAVGGATLLEYDSPEAGFTTVTRPDGLTVRYEFDSHHHTLEEVIDPGGLHVRRAWEYDGAGRPAFYTQTATIDTFTEYDERGNLLRRVDPIGRETSYQYTALNDVQTATLPAGQMVLYEYENGNLTARTEVVTHPTYSAPLELITSYGRAANGLLTQLVDVRGFTTTYGYDEHGYGRVVTHHLGAGQIVTRATTYNDAGWKEADD
jgi:YD repeat-containing protein